MKKILALVTIILVLACSKKVHNIPVINFSVLDFDKNELIKFNYFSNGHISDVKEDVKTVTKEGEKAYDIIKASDAKSWAGVVSVFEKPVYLADGKIFLMDVWMDHIGSISFKLEGSVDGGRDVRVNLENTKINQWETLSFDFSELVLDGPSYNSIAIFIDIHKDPTGKDVHNYITNIQQVPNGKSRIIKGDKSQAVKIVVLGSSTAAGAGPKDIRNAWVNRWRRKLQSINGYHEVINLAVGGYTTYQLLPDGTSVGENKPKPDTDHNVTKALTHNPDAVVINLPSNDINLGFNIEEQMANYDKICQPLYDKGIPVWISTTQGRNFDKEKRELQKLMKDATLTKYGRRTLDFWRGFAHWDNTVKKELDSGDGVHMNDLGHQLLFEEVWKKDILGVILDKKAGIIRKDTAYMGPLYREGFMLSWQDEFDGNELDKASWTHDIGDGCPELCGWGNNEKGWYRPENTKVKDGKLIITAHPDKEHKGYWSSSKIITSEKVNFKFGRIDVRAKLPKTKGMWPAIWLLGQNIKTATWPYCGEIDMMEEVGHIPHRVMGTVFYRGENIEKETKGWAEHKSAKYELKYGDFSDDFHLYSIEWTSQGIKYFVDDILYTERKFNKLKNLNPDDNPFLKPFYMILNLAVGGTLPGYPDETTEFPQTLEVDYIRYFKDAKDLYHPKKEKIIKNVPKKENLWIYLLAGQSNMAGSGTVGPLDTIPNDRIITMNYDNEWIAVKEPLHYYMSKHRGLDCGYSFGNTFLKMVPDSVSIALIPCAIGGSGIDDWLSDSLYLGHKLWSRMKTNIARTGELGTFKGMLWHQGETDTKPHLLASYEEKLLRFFKRVRTEVGVSNMPIVVGELGRFNTHRPNWLELNATLAKISMEHDHIDYIKTSDLKDKGDSVHFDSPSLRTMGKRYAEKMIHLTKK